MYNTAVKKYNTVNTVVFRMFLRSYYVQSFVYKHISLMCSIQNAKCLWSVVVCIVYEGAGQKKIVFLSYPYLACPEKKTS
jgi:hypothetical protein